MSTEWNRLVRVEGRDKPVSQVLTAALAGGRLPIQGRNEAREPDSEDDTLIDLALHTEAPSDAAHTEAPKTGAGFAGFSSQQRYRFVEWMREPAQPAPAAFLQLYLAHLEVRLFEEEPQASDGHGELLRLQSSGAWHGHDLLARVVLLGFWLRQDGPSLAHYLATGPDLPPALLGLALGWQGLMGSPLQPEQIQALMDGWRIASPRLRSEVLTLRLSSLASLLGAEPLVYCLARLPEEERASRPWRGANRDLRITLPQPNLQSSLQPLLVEMLAVADAPDEPVQTRDAVGPNTPTRDEPGWRLILEFGHSRADAFNQVVRQSQRMPGFAQIMDENRKLVYRLSFKRNEMQRFWPLWDIVRKWSSTHVYLNGQELENGQVWPYSQYLR